MLRERNRDLDEFAHVASHDLRAPLRAMSNLANWLEEDIADSILPENRRQLSLIRNRAKRLDDFITGLLKYSRAGRQGLHSTLVDVTALLGRIVNTLDVPAGLTIVKPYKKYKIRTQELLLQQVLTNLIGNAIKYHDKADGTVSTALSPDSPRIYLEPSSSMSSSSLAASISAGICTWKVEPTPTSLFEVMLPFIIFTKEWVIANPKPVPA